MRILGIFFRRAFITRLTAAFCLVVYFAFVGFVVPFHNHQIPGPLSVNATAAEPADASNPMLSHDCLVCQMTRSDEKIIPAIFISLTTILSCGYFLFAGESRTPAVRFVLTSKSRAPPVSPSI